MAQIYEIGEARARRLKVAKIKEILGELFHHVAIPPTNILQEELDYILPMSGMRNIDDLTLGEMDDLLNGDMKFFIVK